MQVCGCNTEVEATSSDNVANVIASLVESIPETGIFPLQDSKTAAPVKVWS